MKIFQKVGFWHLIWGEMLDEGLFQARDGLETRLYGEIIRGWACRLGLAAVLTNDGLETRLYGWIWRGWACRYGVGCSFFNQRRVGNPSVRRDMEGLGLVLPGCL
jgi:hypothetical protein